MQCSATILVGRRGGKCNISADTCWNTECLAEWSNEQCNGYESSLQEEKDSLLFSHTRTRNGDSPLCNWQADALSCIMVSEQPCSSPLLLLKKTSFVCCSAIEHSEKEVEDTYQPSEQTRRGGTRLSR